MYRQEPLRPCAKCHCPGGAMAAGQSFQRPGQKTEPKKAEPKKAEPKMQNQKCRTKNAEPKIYRTKNLQNQEMQNSKKQERKRDNVQTGFSKRKHGRT
nr:hypothetical protein [uncultured Acetatifactor sp.]